MEKDTNRVKRMRGETLSEIEVTNMSVENKLRTNYIKMQEKFSRLERENDILKEENENLRTSAKKNHRMLQEKDEVIQRLEKLSVIEEKMIKKEEKIGEGSFGTVMKTKYGDSQIAIKETNLCPASITELVLMLKFSHPNLVGALSWSVTDKKVKIGMQLCETDLYTMLYEKAGEQEEEWKIKIVKDSVLGVKHLHMLGVIHRDIKPENILIVEKTAKLADFGSSVVGEWATGWVGTQGYRAPEMFESKKYQNSVDIWALGATIHEVITGKYLVDSDASEKVERDPSAKWSLASSRFDGIVELCKDLLIREPKNRVSASELAQKFSKMGV